jgi:plasmid stabilization system protein ParE
VTRVLWAPQAIQDVEAIRAHVARDSARYADLVVERIVAAVDRLQTTLALDVSYLNLATTRSVRSSTAIIESSTAYEVTSSRSRPCFMVPACSDLSESADIRASNFPMNPPAASRCSAARRYRER